MTNIVHNTKIGEVENKVTDVIGLVIANVFNTKIGEVEKKIPDVCGLVKKKDCNIDHILTNFKMLVNTVPFLMECQTMTLFTVPETKSLKQGNITPCL